VLSVVALLTDLIDGFVAKHLAVKYNYWISESINEADSFADSIMGASFMLLMYFRFFKGTNHSKTNILFAVATATDIIWHITDAFLHHKVAGYHSPLAKLYAWFSLLNIITIYSGSYRLHHYGRNSVPATLLIGIIRNIEGIILSLNLESGVRFHNGLLGVFTNEIGSDMISLYAIALFLFSSVLIVN
jgi:hypothetical protein